MNNENNENNIVLPEMEKLVVSTSPHIHNGASTSRIMLMVIFALIPACISSVLFFGPDALRVIFWCSFFCLITEWGCCKIMNKPVSLGDFSALLTGILLALNLSSMAPWWLCAIGAVLAIVLAKQLYGGLGYNPFNPALVARVGLLIAFPKHMTIFPAPTPAISSIEKISHATSYATPLTNWQANGVIESSSSDIINYFIGNCGGCIGETSALALILGGIFLIYKKLIRWQVPCFYILTVAVITGIIHVCSPETTPPPLFHILTGGLLIGAFFMATDMVTSPLTKLGSILFAIGCGVMTCVIRQWGGYPEGVSFSILFMNALTPFIDRYTTGKPFGTKKKGTDK
ncbi:MAG: RnfABCDGE type electron transport complex subunit D [Verrucomicrobiota bacterium]|nr:RnfABCDGE type electron transport complex subunit D [Verrucomicrobiota bacterium]